MFSHTEPELESPNATKASHRTLTRKENDMSTKTQVSRVRHQQVHAGNGELRKRPVEKSAGVVPKTNEEEHAV
jgi:hypothetical protein